jgi:hypothetical protein
LTIIRRRPVELGLKAKGNRPLARCLGLAVLKLRDGWAPFERERPSPWPYNHAEQGIWSSAMMLGLTILAVLTFLAISEVRKTQGKRLKNED